jgi:hypothetical protein
MHVSSDCTPSEQSILCSSPKIRLFIFPLILSQLSSNYTDNMLTVGFWSLLSTNPSLFKNFHKIVILSDFIELYFYYIQFISDSWVSVIGISRANFYGAETMFQEVLMHYMQ